MGASPVSGPSAKATTFAVPFETHDRSAALRLRRAPAAEDRSRVVIAFLIRKGEPLSAQESFWGLTIIVGGPSKQQGIVRGHISQLGCFVFSERILAS